MDRDSVSGWIGPGGCWYSHIRGELLSDHWDLCLCVFCCLEVYLTRHMWHNCCTSVPSYWKSRYSSLFSFGWSPAQTLQKFTIMQDSNEAVQDMPEVGWFWSCSDLWQILYVLTLFPMKSIIVGIGESVCVFCFEQTHIQHTWILLFWSNWHSLLIQLAAMIEASSQVLCGLCLSRI